MIPLAGILIFKKVFFSFKIKKIILTVSIYNTSYGGFGASSSSGGGGGGDDWLDELGGGSSSSSTTTSSYSFSSGPSFNFGGEEEKEEEKKEENKPKEPTKKYLNSTYPAVDNALMFHVVVQVLVEHIERARKLGLWKVEASFMYTNLKTLSLKSGIAVNDIVLELLRYCVARQYIQQAWDLLLEYPDVPSHQLLFFASQYFPPERKHLALLFGAANDIISIANHITSHPLGATQARHISALAVEMYECAESIKEPIPAEETSLIYSAIYLAEFISAWVMEEMPIMENLIKISNIKSATEAYKAGEKAIEEAEHEDLLDDEDDKPQNEPSNAFWLSQLLHLVVLKKFVSNIEEFLSIMQASRAPSSVKLVQHLVRWLRQQQGKLGQIPRSLQKTQTQSHSATTILQNFADLVRAGRFYSPVIQIWNYISKVEIANDYAASIFVNDEKSHDVLLEYKMTFEPEVVLYKDHDILQSFCINAADNQYVAVATTKGIKEIDLRQVHVGEGGDGTNEEDGEGSVGTGEEYTSSSQLRQSGESVLRRSNVTSKSTASLPSFKTKQGILKMAINTLTPSKELDHNIIVQWVESHPHDPYYLSGGIDGSVCLWQFGVPEALAAYRLPPHPWVMRCRFNPSGTKFGACDMAGNLALWKFNAPEDALRPFHSMQAHTKSTLDFTFLNSGSFLATVGISQESPKRNVCLWDVLQPPHKALVSAFTDHEAGATSVVYSPRHQLLVSGGKKGGIYVFDIRQNKLMESFKAHTHNTKSLSMDLMEQFAVSGASDGNIKVWDLATLNCREVWEDVHKKQTFVRPTGVFKSPVSTYGVMAVGVVGEHIYSCGADKRLIKRKFNYGTM